MDLDDRVSQAFHAWEESRMELGRAKAQLHGATPLDQQLRVQLLQSECDEKFKQLLAVAELVSAERGFGSTAP